MALKVLSVNQLKPQFGSVIKEIPASSMVALEAGASKTCSQAGAWERANALILRERYVTLR
ncbi:hypothetical protein H6F93_20250 [Leptolyngbya sp. FACHB-671]|uniref:hypothetical protein n=1 Tax=Leptolyngbya sp. FACHB-671 TaxID=2692812 RepID=UPI001683FFE3|nr:hypothetical protein [Leptolyngbya sp. FACHB-671]MBD2069816.1 hypothetical protein [Leptolyngbya sp. FACHB-671]